MTGPDREAVAGSLTQQFRVNPDFLAASAVLKLRMRRKKEEAQRRIHRREEESQEKSPSPRQLTLQRPGPEGTDSPGGENDKSMNFTLLDDGRALSPNRGRSSSAGGGRRLSVSFKNFADDESKAEKPKREAAISTGVELLRQRLDHLRLAQCNMQGDGNCQFRAFSHQIYGCQEAQHAWLRLKIVQYMKEHKEDYCFYFDGDGDWRRYLRTMSRLGTWGDELTIRAATYALNINVHVLTSNTEHYYMQYEASHAKSPAESSSSKPVPGGDSPTKSSAPEGGASGSNAKTGESKVIEVSSPGGVPPPALDVFLAYISPIHYNSIIRRKA